MSLRGVWKVGMNLYVVCCLSCFGYFIGIVGIIFCVCFVGIVYVN